LVSFLCAVSRSDSTGASVSRSDSTGASPRLRTLLGLGALAAGLLFLLVPRRAANVVLPLTVAVFFGLS
jgi:hypothetical protein